MDLPALAQAAVPVLLPEATWSGTLRAAYDLRGRRGGSRWRRPAASHP